MPAALKVIVDDLTVASVLPTKHKQSSHVFDMNVFARVILILCHITHLADFMYIPDRTTQGIINSISLMQMMRGRFVREQNVVLDGVSTIDPSKTASYGNSEAGSFGTIYIAMTPDVTYARWTERRVGEKDGRTCK